MTARLLAGLLLLSLLPPTLAESGRGPLTRDLSGLEEPVRRRRIARLIGLGPAGHLTLRRLAEHEEPCVRASLARELGAAPADLSVPLLERLLADVDPVVRSEAVRTMTLSLGVAGARRIQAFVKARPQAWPGLRSGVLYWSGIYVHRELAGIDKRGGTGWYPNMFHRLMPLGKWATPALLRIFTRKAQGGRMDPLQRLAGNALGDLGDKGAIPALRKLFGPDKWDVPRSQRECAAVALYKLGYTAEANRLINSYKLRTGRGLRLGRPGLSEQEYVFKLAYLQHQLRRFQAAIDTYKRLTFPGSRYASIAHYNMACAYAMLRKKEHALHSLHQALLAGYEEKAWIHQDRELDLIRKDPRFARMLRDHKAKIRFDLASER